MAEWYGVYDKTGACLEHAQHAVGDSSCHVVEPGIGA